MNRLSTTDKTEHEGECQACKHVRSVRYYFDGYYCAACIKWNEEMLEDDDE